MILFPGVFINYFGKGYPNQNNNCKFALINSKPFHMSSNINDYINQNKDRFLNELFELLRIPSVSADPKYKGDVLKTAEAVKAKLEAAGAEKTEICPTDGYPIVYGEKTIDPKLPTVLVYGHYD